MGRGDDRPLIDVLIPTRDRVQALTATLASLCFQLFSNFRIIIANQGDRRALDTDPLLWSVVRLLGLHGQRVIVLDNLPPRGLAQQRHFLLQHVTAPLCLFLDDDIMLEPFVLRNLHEVLTRYKCGFAGNAPIGLSFAEDYRPEEERIEFWEDRVKPEAVRPSSPAWQRHRLHNAANLLHVQQRLGISANQPRAYKVAWVGGCVLFDVQKLRSAGGFSFWADLPKNHSGEDVLAQLRVMKAYGGCGVLPSGAYHQELPTTVFHRKVDAPLWLPM
jgi:glycosyltransferase involved in cell wall biosynthesis